jgi:hypothetical protein
MAVFRRSSAGATDGTAQGTQGARGSGAPANETVQERSAREVPAAEAKKGRPTPKRSDSERNRYQPITGTRGGGASGPRTAEDKARSRSDRARQMDAMKRGEAVLPRDKGPARQLTRDYVDAHRRPSEYFMILVIGLLLVTGLLQKTKSLAPVLPYLEAALLALLVLDIYFLRRGLFKLVAQRLPGESTSGLTMYAVSRALQIRRWRMPSPRIKPGDKF